MTEQGTPDRSRPSNADRHPINDETWMRISPMVLGGTQAGPEERPDLRAAVDAFLQADTNDGRLPAWVENPEQVAAIHNRWRNEGTASHIRRMASTEPNPSTPVEPPTSIVRAPSTSEPSAPAPARQELPRTGAEAHNTDASPSATSEPETGAEHLQLSDRARDTHAPPVTEEMIRHFEQWVRHHYFLAHETDDWFENELGRHYLPHFRSVLDLLYGHWHVENDQPWPHAQLYEPMPTDEWMNRTAHSRAIVIVTDNLKGSYQDLEHAVRDVFEVAIRGTPYRSAEQDQHDRIIRISADKVLQMLDNLKGAVQSLQILGTNELREARPQETKAPQQPAPTPAPAAGTTSRATQTPRGAAGHQSARERSGQHIENAIKWAKQHGNTIRPGELAHHLVNTDEQPARSFPSLRAALTTTVTRDTRFTRIDKGLYQLTETDDD